MGLNEISFSFILFYSLAIIKSWSCLLCLLFAMRFRSSRGGSRCGQEEQGKEKEEESKTDPGLKPRINFALGLF
ncbi:hypothetical protein QBC43DRAFT_307626 [Cladorrhinum sp. PSN259]|nr:hypothetical protein QBC43DRAFT_307626 [Cladorrhinum sp. PSN259]